MSSKLNCIKLYCRTNRLTWRMLQQWFASRLLFFSKRKIQFRKFSRKPPFHYCCTTPYCSLPHSHSLQWMKRSPLQSLCLYLHSAVMHAAYLRGEVICWMRDQLLPVNQPASLWAHSIGPLCLALYLALVNSLASVTALILLFYCSLSLITVVDTPPGFPASLFPSLFVSSYLLHPSSSLNHFSLVLILHAFSLPLSLS